MKILFLIDSLSLGGKEKQLITLIKGLKKLPSFEIKLIIKKNKIDFTELHKLEISIVTLKNKYNNYLLFFLKVCVTIISFKPDIVHSWDHLLTLFSIPAAKLSKAKIINGSIRYAVHAKPFSKLWLFSKVTFHFCNIIVANSLAGLYAHNLKESKKNVVIYNGFDINEIPMNISKEEIKDELKIRSKYVIGMIANFLPSKDYETFIKAAKMLLKESTDIAFVFIGEGRLRRLFEEIILQEEKKHFYFLGKRMDVLKIIKAFDIGILLSNVNGHAEGFPNTVMEIMASGIPVIATRAGGNVELINDTIDGFLVSPFNATEVKEKIWYLLNNPEKRIEMGLFAKQNIENRYNIDIYINNYIKLYNALLV